MDFDKTILNVLKQRYLLRDKEGNVIEEPEEMFERVADDIAKANRQYEDERSYDDEKNEFTQKMKERKFMPNSPTLMNANGELQQLAACFVLPISDSMEGIYQAVKDTALIHQSGGGTGFSFSRIRPEGDVVKSTGGKASGPLSFLNVFNESTNTVKQGGKRRGANMGILHVSHPDIYDWVTAKEDEENFTNFNMSVAVDEEFMEAVKNEEEYELINPRDGEVWDTIDAREMFDEICKQAHRNGEPGIIFLDKINEENPFLVNSPQDKHYIEATNPCLTGDTKVAVADGREAVEIQKLAEDENNVLVYSLNDNNEIEIKNGLNPWKTREDAEIVEIKTDGNVKLRCTADHEIKVKGEGFKEAGELDEGDSLQIMTKFDAPIGAVVSDESGGTNYRFVNNGWGENTAEHRLIARDILDENISGKVIHHKDFNAKNNAPENLEVMSKDKHDEVHDISGKENPLQILKECGEFEEYMERNPFYNTEGKNNPMHGRKHTEETKKKISKNIDYEKISEKNKKNTQKIWDKVKENDRRIECKECGEEFKVINAQHLKSHNMTTNEYRKKYPDAPLTTTAGITKNHKVESVKKVGTEDVYDLTVEDNHNFFAGIDSSEGKNKKVFINVHNCGEQPLEPYGACNLGHINLSKCYDGDSSVNWDYLSDMVDLGVRFLDNVIDRGDYPIEEIEEKVNENRKIGLGVMGWHDLLMKLEIPYDSESAIELAREVMEFINKKGHEKSKELAENRGEFPAFDESTYDEPIRNATLTTIAPTGTTSMIASCSSGIEPVFALTYQKKVMDDEKVTRTNDILESKLKERELWDEDVREKIKNKKSIRDVDEVPSDLKKVFKTAMEIDPEWHIRMQAAFQDGTDDAVSKTINFDQDASVGDIKRSYLLAYEEGCKGLTVYRDRSRDEQALETEGSLEETGRLESYDRNNWLSGETKEMKMGCQKNLFVTCNSDEGGNLREVFGVLGKPGGCVRSFADALGIVISIALQEGVEPKDIIRKLKMIRCPNPDTLSENKKYSCPDAIARTMEDYININGDGVEIDVETSAGNLPECPDCGGNLVFEEGCVKCHSCGYSKC